MISMSAAERRRRLQTRHRLTADTRVADIVATADAMIALHATDPATVFLSAWARVGRSSQPEMADAISVHKRLVRMMAMRRTMFVVGDDLAPVLQASSAVEVAATQRKRLLSALAQAGLDGDLDAWLTDVSASTMRALISRGHAQAADLVADEPRLNTVLDISPGKSYGGPQKITSRVLTLLALEGRIVRGATVGGWTSNRTEWWPADAWMPGGLGHLDPAAARVELAARWLRVFGPAPVADLKWWTGWTLGQVRAALTSVPTVEVDLDGTPGVALADDLDPTPEPEPTAALLPALDPTPMGWAERGWFLGDHRSQLFDATGNIGPTILWRGSVVGGWAQRPDGQIRTHLLQDIGSAGQDAVDARAAELRDWLGPLRAVPRFHTPLERELLR
ncbi:Winged helix DNA-binding domain-containing protein [Nakamurella panacisegetis]|uniref:Winged helix DNA-binding domain-containing protein n=1 Tax=Nakamurella panacisegetis TaxID=1090615 RepID=A0A1H0N2Y2_9ACTN|nr:winged helix DNA-binding domain-containing protein [Nakamurella panacisegetis]SDO87013.1 Winged helix DNA-binding domain-containing protein [Nakamurella panacisegetis]